MSEQNGGAAFPSPRTAALDEAQGMSLRDYFAGQASIGLVLAASIAKGELIGPTAVGVIAYRYADAMLAEREQR